MKKLIYESTYYSLFLYFLYDSKWKEKDYLFYGDRINEDNLRAIAKHINVLEKSYEYIGRRRPMPKVYKQPLKYVAQKIQQKNIFANYDLCIGNVRQINNWLVKTPRIQMEDGTLTRTELSKGIKRSNPLNAMIKLLLLKEAQKLDRIQKFIVAKEISLHENFKNKVEVINLFKLWSQKSRQEQKEILEVFKVNADDFLAINESTSILFPQPLSEMYPKTYTETKKVNGYRILLEKLGINESNLVIKPHPRETTVYENYFPNAVILKPSFPGELIPMLDIKVNKVVSLSSTVCSSFEGSCNEVVYARAPSYFELPPNAARMINNHVI